METSMQAQTARCSSEDKAMDHSTTNCLKIEELPKKNSTSEEMSGCQDDEDIHYICTVSKVKTSIPVSVIRLAPPSTRPSVIQHKPGQSPGTPVISGKTATDLDHDEIRIQCHLCNKQFTQQRNYNYHMAQHNGSQLFACTCPICFKSYRNKGYLSNHLKIHRNAKEYRCEWCSKSFNQRVAYNTHIRVHTGYCPHKCPHCPKAFSRKTVLTSHIRTHTGEKPFKCSMCEKTFVDKSNMLTHQRLHTGEKPFRCHICQKAFTQRNHLKTHINYHVGIKPYHCTKCNARFSQSSNLKMHSHKCTGILRAESVNNGSENFENSDSHPVLIYKEPSLSATFYKDRAKEQLPKESNSHVQSTSVQNTFSELPSHNLNSQGNALTSDRNYTSILAQRLMGKIK